LLDQEDVWMAMDIDQHDAVHRLAHAFCLILCSQLLQPSVVLSATDRHGTVLQGSVGDERANSQGESPKFRDDYIFPCEKGKMRTQQVGERDARQGWACECAVCVRERWGECAVYVCVVCV
jgi:hypothetical protein